ncbi:N-acetyltransferase [Micromonospora sp. WMMD1082]|uniref:GNAT family N-acetyltransferase n=1 Tax=Micromonospora sp. WMMD1082 TaxID=3016104 RepID=UPI0024180C0D|nr:N-acetyltransferase [Micromonospora sp. WMMD1082]MDG4795976.1 N-acetyltransferase [Micromonospora sp. WMMD1082]
MELRAERTADHDAVHELHRRAFGDHGDAVARLVPALRDADPEALSLVAEQAGGIVGHVMFTRSLLDAPRRLVPVQVLSPLAVSPDRQRQGIGSALVRHGLRLLDARGVPAVFLEGDPAYYRRLGFTAAGARGFRRPSLRIPEPAFQVMTLAGYEPWMTGTLVYSATFWEKDCVGLREDAVA